MHTSFLTRVVMRNITFPNDIIPAYWFNGKLRITELEIIDRRINFIQPNAFNTDVFTNLITLTLTNMPIEILLSGIFNGLHRVYEIILNGLKIHTCASDVFMPCKKLMNLMVYNLDSIEIDLMDLLVSVKPKVETIAVRNFNLTKSNIKKALAKTIKVVNLDLRQNRITEIEKDAFALLDHSLRTLNLGENLLKTLSDGLIPLWFLGEPERNKFIELGGNPFQCTCELSYTQAIYRNFTHRFVTRLYCYVYGPPMMRYDLLTAPICVDHNNVVASTSSSLSTTKRTTWQPNVLSDAKDNWWSRDDLKTIIVAIGICAIFVTVIGTVLAYAVSRCQSRRQPHIGDIFLNRRKCEPYVFCTFYS